ncbi:DUF3906 family protein [Alteribacillus sp. HJP-4]|uniref:DUF3906 family protein n=1 Tax=Alteribacillus sp. HJP-4 TaxID=2775394 RepID=UPI0035CCF57D
MNLYRIEAETKDYGVVYVAVAAESEEKAFELAEVEVEKSFLRLPVIENLCITQKRSIKAGAAFVFAEDPVQTALENNNFQGK